MHNIDKKTCRNIAYILLAVYAGMNLGFFYIDVPIGNRESLGRSAATLENLLLIMAGFFYGASLKENIGISPIEGDGVATKQTVTQNTSTETVQDNKPV